MPPSQIKIIISNTKIRFNSMISTNFRDLTLRSQYDTFVLMSKRRKTKKQKLRSESRRHQQEPTVQLQEVEAREEERHTHVTHSIAGITIPNFASPNPTASVNKTRYSYVVHDVRNTLTILTIIVAANLILYFLIQRGIIKLAW